MALLWTLVQDIGSVGVGTTYYQIANPLPDVGIIKHVLVRSFANHTGGTLKVALGVANPETDDAESWLRAGSSGVAGGSAIFRGYDLSHRGSLLTSSGNWISTVRGSNTVLYMKLIVTGSTVTSGKLRVAIYGEPYFA